MKLCGANENVGEHERVVFLVPRRPDHPVLHHFAVCLPRAEDASVQVHRRTRIEPKTALLDRAVQNALIFAKFLLALGINRLLDSFVRHLNQFRSKSIRLKINSSNFVS